MPAPPSERNELVDDLIEALLGANAICPDGIGFSQMEASNWFAHDDLERMHNIIGDLVESESPLQRVSEDRSKICLSSRDQAKSFQKELREDNDWWEY